MSVLEGVLAIHKPPKISSFDVIRTVTPLFRKSALFEPLIAREKDRRSHEEGRQEMSANKAHRKRQALSKGRIARNNALAQLKIGHGGTLDPLATGVLIIGVGNGTKSLQAFLNGTKEYECIVLFGAETDTYDSEGKVTEIKSCDHVTRESVLKAIESLKQKKTQFPPKYSAVRVKGKHLYDYARNDEKMPEIKAREVSLHEAELLEWLEPDEHDFELPSQEAKRDDELLEDRQVWSKSLLHKRKRDDEVTGAAEEPETKIARTSSTATGVETQRSQVETKTSAEVDLTTTDFNADGLSPGNSNGLQEINGPRPKAARIRLKVSSGYYVRSFCHDLGKEVDSAGIMASLVRTRVSDFELGKNVIEFGEFEKGSSVWEPQVERLLKEWMAKNETAVPEHDSGPTAGQLRKERRQDHEIARARTTMRLSASPE